jgi:hypothetical protein
LAPYLKRSNLGLNIRPNQALKRDRAGRAIFVNFATNQIKGLWRTLSKNPPGLLAWPLGAKGLTVIHFLLSTIVCGIILYGSLDVGYPIFPAMIILIYIGQLIGIFEIRPTLSLNSDDAFDLKIIGFSALNQYKELCRSEDRSLFWWWIEWSILMMLMILFIVFIVEVFFE